MNKYFLSAEEVQKIKLQTIEVTCKGACRGGTIFQKGIFIDCTCKRDFQNTISLVSSGIPPKYWNFNFRNLLKKFIDSNENPLLILKSYVNRLPEMIKEGYGLYIVGVSGLAKTALGSYILKEALKLDYICYFIRMSQLTKMCIEQFRDEDQKEKLLWIKKDVQLLLIDEIEKDYHIDDPNSFTGTHVNEFFDDLYGSNKSIIVTSNVPKKDLKGIHSSSVIDRLEELVDIVLTGQSYRGQNQIRDKILGLNKENKKG